MSPSRRRFALAVPAFLLVLAPPPSSAAQDLVLVNANVVDVEAGTVRSDATIVVRDGSIVSLDGGSPPPGAPVVDVQGMYVTPGLMDAHVHIGSEEQARRALESGVTTARSAGAGHYADVGLRELVRGGHATGPELFAAGYHVRPGMGEAFFLDHPRLGHHRDQGIATPASIRDAVRANLDRGVDWIKTNATERAGLPDTDPRKQLFDEQELGVMADEAEAGGAPLMAHAHGDAGARAAVAAGARSIEHGTYLSPATLRLMAERNTYLVPTMAIVADLTVPGGDYDNAVLNIRGRHMLPRVRETARAAHELGVSIVAATDTGYGPASTVRLAHELIELVEHAGMTPAEALRAATVTPARMLGIDGRTGRLAAGLEADLLVVERNPLDDIAVMQDVLLVVSDGRVIVQRGDWPAVPAT